MRLANSPRAAGSMHIGGSFASNLWRFLAVFCAAFLSSFFLIAAAYADYPQLSGHVVDAAQVLSPQTRQNLTDKLSALQQQTGAVVVVATIPSLGSDDVDKYTNDLFHHWGIGDKELDNGLLFLLAPKERKVRIEVGDGLQGQVTDAISGIILRTSVLPKLKKGDLEGAVSAGVDSIGAALSTNPSEPPKPDNRMRRDRTESLFDQILPFIVFGAVILFLYVISRGGGRGRGYGGPIIFPIPGPFGGGGSDSGGGGFFGGGGGDSSGGGASSEW